MALKPHIRVYKTSYLVKIFPFVSGPKFFFFFFLNPRRSPINCHQIRVTEAPMGSKSEGKWDIRIPMCLRFENYPAVLGFTHSFPITELLLSPVRI